MTGLSQKQLEAVLEGLGLSAVPEVDPEGLGEVYRAWCQSIPFDNVRKMIALLRGDSPPLPGIRSEDFFDAFLEHGTGGTCWPSSNGLYRLLEACGQPVRRVSGSMFDSGMENHGSIVARFEDDELLVDSSILTSTPIPLPRQEVHVTELGNVALEVERIDETWRLWIGFRNRNELMPCRILADPASSDLYRQRYEESRGASPFNTNVYARRVRGNEIRVVAGTMLQIHDADGTREQKLGEDEIVPALIEHVGLSEAIVEEWQRAGGLASSLEASRDQPKPPTFSEQPPSRRATQAVH